MPLFRCHVTDNDAIFSISSLLSFLHFRHAVSPCWLLFDTPLIFRAIIFFSFFSPFHCYFLIISRLYASIIITLFISISVIRLSPFSPLDLSSVINITSTPSHYHHHHYAFFSSIVTFLRHVIISFHYAFFFIYFLLVDITYYLMLMLLIIIIFRHYFHIISFHVISLIIVFAIIFFHYFAPFIYFSSFSSLSIFSFSSSLPLMRAARWHFAFDYFSLRYAPYVSIFSPSCWLLIIIIFCHWCFIFWFRCCRHYADAAIIFAAVIFSPLFSIFRCRADYFRHFLRRYFLDDASLALFFFFFMLLTLRDAWCRWCCLMLSLFSLSLFFFDYFSIFRYASHFLLMPLPLFFFSMLPSFSPFFFFALRHCCHFHYAWCRFRCFSFLSSLIISFDVHFLILLPLMPLLIISLYLFSLFIFVTLTPPFSLRFDAFLRHWADIRLFRRHCLLMLRFADAFFRLLMLFSTLTCWCFLFSPPLIDYAIFAIGFFFCRLMLDVYFDYYFRRFYYYAFISTAISPSLFLSARCRCFDVFRWLFSPPPTLICCFLFAFIITILRRLSLFAADFDFLRALIFSPFSFIYFSLMLSAAISCHYVDTPHYRHYFRLRHWLRWFSPFSIFRADAFAIDISPLFSFYAVSDIIYWGFRAMSLIFLAILIITPFSMLFAIAIAFDAILLRDALSPDYFADAIFRFSPSFRHYFFFLMLFAITDVIIDIIIWYFRLRCYHDYYFADAADTFRWYFDAYFDDATLMPWCFSLFRELIFCCYWLPFDVFDWVDATLFFYFPTCWLSLIDVTLFITLLLIFFFFAYFHFIFHCRAASLSLIFLMMPLTPAPFLMFLHFDIIIAYADIWCCFRCRFDAPLPYFIFLSPFSDAAASPLCWARRYFRRLFSRWLRDYSSPDYFFISLFHYYFAAATPLSLRWYFLFSFTMPFSFNITLLSPFITSLRLFSLPPLIIFSLWCCRYFDAYGCCLSFFALPLLFDADAIILLSPADAFFHVIIIYFAFWLMMLILHFHCFRWYAAIFADYAFQPVDYYCCCYVFRYVFATLTLPLLLILFSAAADMMLLIWWCWSDYWYYWYWLFHCHYADVSIFATLFRFLSPFSPFLCRRFAITMLSPFSPLFSSPYFFCWGDIWCWYCWCFRHYVTLSFIIIFASLDADADIFCCRHAIATIDAAPLFSSFRLFAFADVDYAAFHYLFDYLFISFRCWSCRHYRCWSCHYWYWCAESSPLFSLLICYAISLYAPPLIFFWCRCAIRYFPSFRRVADDAAMREICLLCRLHCLLIASLRHDSADAAPSLLPRYAAALYAMLIRRDYFRSAAIDYLRQARYVYAFTCRHAIFAAIWLRPLRHFLPLFLHADATTRCWYYCLLRHWLSIFMLLMLIIVVIFASFADAILYIADVLAIFRHAISSAMLLRFRAQHWCYACRLRCRCFAPFSCRHWCLLILIIDAFRRRLLFYDEHAAACFRLLIIASLYADFMPWHFSFIFAVIRCVCRRCFLLRLLPMPMLLRCLRHDVTPRFSPPWCFAAERWEEFAAIDYVFSFYYYAMLLMPLRRGDTPRLSRWCCFTRYDSAIALRCCRDAFLMIFRVGDTLMPLRSCYIHVVIFDISAALII